MALSLPNVTLTDFCVLNLRVHVGPASDGEVYIETALTPRLRPHGERPETQTGVAFYPAELAQSPGFGNAIREQVIAALAREVDEWLLVDGKAVRG